MTIERKLTAGRACPPAFAFRVSNIGSHSNHNNHAFDRLRQSAIRSRIAPGRLRRNSQARRDRVTNEMFKRSNIKLKNCKQKLFNFSSSYLSKFLSCFLFFACQHLTCYPRLLTKHKGEGRRQARKLAWACLHE